MEHKKINPWLYEKEILLEDSSSGVAGNAGEGEIPWIQKEGINSHKHLDTTILVHTASYTL